MDARHDLSVDHSRLLASAGYASMDNSATGHPNAQQLRPPYGDLCRPPGSDASTLSAAYHSRYMASMPLTAGSTFPFLGGMFTGALPGPPTSPFRAPSTPGVNSMRFWPPTPPPDGYGRYSMNTSLFPLFGPQTDASAFLSQNLVSRLGTTHLSPVMDHKEHSFFSHGLGLGSPLTPTGHVTSPSSFPHLIPSLERHPSYLSHMTLGTKELEDLPHEDVRLMKGCLSPQRQKSLNKSVSEERSKLSPSCNGSKGHDRNADGKNKNLTNKVQPCKIEVNHSPGLKPDILSPPIESPKAPSPCRPSKKSTSSPLVASPPLSETRCSQCCASIKETANDSVDDASVTSSSESAPSTESMLCVVPTPATSSMDSVTTSSTPCDVQATSVLAEKSLPTDHQKSPRNSPVITATTIEEKPTDHPSPKNKVSELLPPQKPVVAVPVKHVTAAVIPTAPKQTVHREIHPEPVFLATSNHEFSKETPSSENAPGSYFSSVPKPLNSFSNLTDSISAKSPVTPVQSKPVKNPMTSCKVKDMIRNLPRPLSSEDNSPVTICAVGNNATNIAIVPNSVSPLVPASKAIANVTKPTCKVAKATIDASVKFNSTDLPPKTEVTVARTDCEFSQKSNWSKATVMPFSWQSAPSNNDDQAINLTVTRKAIKPEPIEIPLSRNESPLTVKPIQETSLLSVGVCHPTPSQVAVNKVKGTPAVSSISNFSSISVVNQPAEQSTEVHILHRSSKSSFPIVNRISTPPVPIKSTISHVTANTSIHRSIKTERLTTKRGKLSDLDKLSHSGRTLAPKLSKTVGFGKDVSTTHTLSATSSVSSTSIVFPATVNPCIPVGIAIAQQRQDSSTTATGKAQASVPTNTSMMTSNSPMNSNRVTADVQTPEVLMDQKNQEIPCSNNPTPVDNASLLVTQGMQGPTIVSRQWESEALTRTAVPSSWVAHTPIVTPAAVWLGQGAYTTTPAASSMPSVAMNPLDASQIALPNPGYSIMRDPMTGQYLLVQNQNVVVDRQSMWPTFNQTTGSMPIQQLVTQQQHTQYEHVVPHSDSLKPVESLSCDITTIKTEDPKSAEADLGGGQAPASVPLAGGGAYAFAAFPTQCGADPGTGFSYVLQSSTVMHLATAAIQADSGRRSQGTSPLQCATPEVFPTQTNATEDEESENETEVSQETEVKKSQSVTLAIQVDMDNQTTSEDDDEDRKIIKSEIDTKIEVSDSANQTESSGSPKDEREQETTLEEIAVVPAETVVEDIPTIKIPEVKLEEKVEIVMCETELAPSLPVESKPVMDFIDHHGLDLLVDSIEEFASREKEEGQVTCHSAKPLASENEPSRNSKVEMATDKPFQYKTIDTACTDGLGLLCALAEQRFLEENMSDKKTDSLKPEDSENQSESSCSAAAGREQSNSNDSFVSSCSSTAEGKETSELDMRAQLVELQKKYRQKQRELALLRNKKDRESSDEEFEYLSNSPKVQKTPSSSKGTLVSGKTPSKLDAAKITGSNKRKRKEENGTDQLKGAVAQKKVKTIKAKSTTPPSSKHQENKVPSITLVHETNQVHIVDSSSAINSVDTSNNSVKKVNTQNSNSDNSSLDQDYYKAWFVRRSERIFLSDAKPVPTPDTSSKKSIPKVNGESTQKEKKDSNKTVKPGKSEEQSENKKGRPKGTTKQKKTSVVKKRSRSKSCESHSSCGESSSYDSDSSDGDSSKSENLPLSNLLESSTGKTTTDRHKRLSTESQGSSILSEDIPLSDLAARKSVPQLLPCILNNSELEENTRLLVLDEGLFYAGSITKSEDPDTYGILIDGERAAKPHVFSKEEILNAAVLEVKPIHKKQLPDGTRVCAFWSQQYRCLYPGTVTKPSSPLTDPTMLFVEFDDGDSGRIPLSDIRMLPPDFPIVSMEPNPFMILGKRRSRAQSQNSVGTNDNKSGNESSCTEKTESKKPKISDKSNKKANSEDKNKDTSKGKTKPTLNQADSSSKSSNAVGDTNTDKKMKTKTDPDEGSAKPKKHKKEHHKHHHHHHKHHHHKKHKHSTDDNGESTKLEGDQDTFILENSSELTVKIKKSPSPHTNEEAATDRKMESSSSSSDEEEEGFAKKKVKKSKLQATQSKPSKRKERVPSVEKSKIAAFLPMRQLWSWSGKGFKRHVGKGKAKKEFFRAIERGRETIRVGDCAVFLSTGRPHLPYIGRIETMWESWGGKMDVKVKWFYHPEETKSGKRMSVFKGALFQSPHFDENDVQTISHKCEVLSFSEFQERNHPDRRDFFDNNDTYFLAGTYDPILGNLVLEPDVPDVPPTPQE